MNEMSKAVEKLLEGVQDPDDIWRRNQTAFTLALVFRDAGFSGEQALEALKWWNRKNAKAFKRDKFFWSSVDYIYSEEGKKEKASWHWIELLSGEKVEEEVKHHFSDVKPGELKERAKTG